MAGLLQCPQRDRPLSSWQPSGSPAALKPAQTPGALQGGLREDREGSGEITFSILSVVLLLKFEVGVLTLLL